MNNREKDRFQRYKTAVRTVVYTSRGVVRARRRHVLRHLSAVFSDAHLVRDEVDQVVVKGVPRVLRSAPGGRRGFGGSGAALRAGRDRHLLVQDRLPGLAAAALNVVASFQSRKSLMNSFFKVDFGIYEWGFLSASGTK